MNGKAVFDEKKQEANQRLVLDNRERLSLGGIIDVVSFDESGAYLKTVTGTLAIDGEDLHVIKLDTDGGSMVFEGRINGLFFSDGAGKGRSKRLFK